MISPEMSHGLDRAATGPPRERRLVAAIVAVLLGTAIWFRLLRLDSVPGISGDEGWWGVQALAWLSGRPYEARTTSGNPIDLFFLVPVALLHAIGSPSFALLRLVPAAANLLALVAAFFFGRRLYGETTAWIHTVTLAVLPTAIAHSRICQDPSQSLFWAGLVVYLALLGATDRGAAWRWFAGALVLFPVALWTHPTNVFVAPFLLLPIAAALAPRIPDSRRARIGLALATAGSLAVGLIVTWLAFASAARSYPSLDKPWLSLAAGRLADGGQWLEFAANNVRLFNGITVIHYFSGARPWTLPYDAGVVLGAVLVLGGFVLAATRRRSPLDAALIAGCAGMWLLFYAFAGPQALRPHAERWGLCLLVPASLVLARGIGAWVEHVPRLRWAAIGTASLAAAALLGSFHVNYFRAFATTGGRSHLTYVTAPTEPKQQALSRILGRGAGSTRIEIATRQWWLYWPISYLATAHPTVSVRLDASSDAAAGFETPARGTARFFVEFAGTPELAATLRRLEEAGQKVTTAAIADAAGRDHLVIVEVQAESP
jgi:4-amino-4-deoxy-L-arabinose transferase-like glycosyltransferase